MITLRQCEMSPCSKSMQILKRYFVHAGGLDVQIFKSEPFRVVSARKHVLLHLCNHVCCEHRADQVLNERSHLLGSGGRHIHKCLAQCGDVLHELGYFLVGVLSWAVQLECLAFEVLVTL